GLIEPLRRRRVGGRVGDQAHLSRESQQVIEQIRIGRHDQRPAWHGLHGRTHWWPPQTAAGRAPGRSTPTGTTVAHSARAPQATKIHLWTARVVVDNPKRRRPRWTVIRPGETAYRERF